MRYAILGVALAVLVSACETMSQAVSGGSPPPAAAFDPGDWSHAPAADTQTQFQTLITARYAAGSSLSDAAAELRRNAFACAANNDTTGRGEPPTQICRKTVNANNCTGTWQVHLFDTHGDGHITRARALFDKRCGREGLLGGPS